MIDKAYNDDDIMEIIVDNNGHCSLFLNGEKMCVTYINFEMDANDMIPTLTTKQFLKDKNNNICITMFETNLNKEKK